VALKFLKMAVANSLRYATRTGLTALGLALAIAAVLFVNVVALSFESGTTRVYDFIRTTSAGIGDVWLTPATGFQLDKTTGFFATAQTMPESLVNQVLQQNGNGGLKVLTATYPGLLARSPILYGCSDCQKVTLSLEAADLLRVKVGDTLTVNQVSLTVSEVGNVEDFGANGLVQIPLAMAQQILGKSGQVSWAMLQAQDSLALRQYLANEANILVSTDPTASDPSKQAIAYFLEERLSRSDMVGFNVKLAAIYFNQAGSSLLGWLAKITLGLGFVLMLSAALLSIEERKREFGIFAAVGVSSDVFYLFFVESLLLFVGSTFVGLILGTLLLELLVPTLFSWETVLKSSVLVVCYLPPMVIFGSLVPAQILLQKSPLELIRSGT
jgi:ABC-type antimicrobial peptide transport system permease subunit